MRPLGLFFDHRVVHGRGVGNAAVLLERLSGDGGRLAAGQQPAARGRSEGQARDDDNEVDDGHMAEGVQVASMPGHEPHIGAGATEQRAEQGEGAGGGTGEGAAGGARGAGYSLFGGRREVRAAGLVG